MGRRQASSWPGKTLAENGLGPPVVGWLADGAYTGINEKQLLLEESLNLSICVTTDCCAMGVGACLISPQGPTEHMRVFGFGSQSPEGLRTVTDGHHHTVNSTFCSLLCLLVCGLRPSLLLPFIPSAFSRFVIIRLT